MMMNKWEWLNDDDDDDDDEMMNGDDGIWIWINESMKIMMNEWIMNEWWMNDEWWMIWMMNK